MSIEQAKFLEGWLVAKEAPPRVMDAIGAVIGALRPGERGVQLPIPIPQFSIAASGLANRIEPEEPAAVADDAPPSQRGRGWSAEARAAAGERMRAAHARRKGARSDQPGNSPAPPAGGA